MTADTEPLTDLAAFCEQQLREASGPIYGTHGLTALNICCIAENRGCERPTKRAVEKALGMLDVTRKRMWHTTWYQLKIGQHGEALPSATHDPGLDDWGRDDWQEES